MSEAALRESRFPVGSSHSSRLGWLTRARAIATRWQFARVQAVQQVAAGGGGVEQREQVQQRGFARAGRPGHRDVVARLDHQVGRAQRMYRRRARVGSGETVQFDHGRGHQPLTTTLSLATSLPAFTGVTWT
jgi:hypothetical protein